jgi:hypothetical protein
MYKARVYFYLQPAAGILTGRFAAGGASALDWDDGEGDTEAGLSESQILAFLHDAHHRFAVIAAQEPTDECARRVLESKHRGRKVVLKSVIWIDLESLPGDESCKARAGSRE